MLGVDLVLIKRIEGFYEKWGVKAYERFLRPEEISLIFSPKTAAGFWAVKEAVSKALGCGISQTCSFYDIWIHKNSLEKPYISLSSKLINKFKIQEASVSITHDGDYAVGIAYLKSSLKSKLLSH